VIVFVFAARVSENDFRLSYQTITSQEHD
jgi:hypothetical protein